MLMLMLVSKLLFTDCVWDGLHFSECGLCTPVLGVMLDASKRRLTIHESFLMIYFTGDRLGEQINVKNDLQTYRSIVNLRLSSSGQSKVIGTTSGHTSSISSSDNESTYLWWRVKLPWSASSWSHVHKIKTMSTNIWLVCCQTRD